MTDADTEMVNQIRRGVLMILGALVKRYGLAWVDFLPRHVTLAVPAPEFQPPTVTGIPEFRR